MSFGGRVYQLITHDSLAERGTQKLKGQYNDGALTLQLARDPQDAGQEKVIEARDSDDSYLFKIELNDATGSPATPTTFTFEALVMGYTANIGGANQVIGANVTVEIQSGSIIETPAGS